MARAEGVTLRMAAIAPEGTAWARETRAFTREVSTQTGDAVRIKWYLGGIAGDELTALGRVRRDQLDGMAGAFFCLELAPSLWVTRLPGLFRDRVEGQQVIDRLRPTLEKEMQQHGFVHIGDGVFGGEIFMSREPIRSMADLRKTRFWLWNLDELLIKAMPAMGMHPVPLPVEGAAAAYDRKEVDGFLSVPTASLAYRWASQVKYFTDLAPVILPACLVLSQRAFDQLTYEQQKIVRAAGAKLSLRFNDLGRQQDDSLLHHLFEQQGLTRVPVSPEFLAEFRRTADQVRDKMVASFLRDKHVPPSVLPDVLGWLSELRAPSPKH